MQPNRLTLILLLVTRLPLGIIAGEATYQGKTAAEWISRVTEDQKFNRAEAIEALREIGPSAVPPIVQLFNRIASWNQATSKQTNGEAFEEIWNHDLPAFACRALVELGPDAK